MARKEISEKVRNLWNYLHNTPVHDLDIKKHAKG